MMSAVDDLLADLQQRGVRLEAHGDRLRYRPRSALTPDLAGRLKEHTRPNYWRSGGCL